MWSYFPNFYKYTTDKLLLYVILDSQEVLCINILEKRFIKSIFCTSVTLSSRVSLFCTCGPLLPHSGNADLPLFGAVLACIPVVETKSELSADLRTWWSMGQEAQFFLSSQKCLQLGDSCAQCHIGVLWSCWIKLRWVIWCHSCSSAPRFPGRTKEKKLSIPLHAAIRLPWQGKHCLWGAANFRWWNLNPWPPRKK